MVLEELELPFDFQVLELQQAKDEAHLSVNPNGRLPTIEDPNTGVTLWEVSMPYCFRSLSLLQCHLR